jgi:hypothetical protein
MDDERGQIKRRIRPREEEEEKPTRRAKRYVTNPRIRMGELLLRESKRVKVKKTYPSDTEYGFCSYIA